MRASDKPIGLHVSIGTAPSGTATLEQELRLLKAALLYADSVKLYSVTASMLTMALRVGDVGHTLQLELLHKVIPYLRSSAEARQLQEGIRRYERSLRNKHPPHHELASRRVFRETLNEHWTRLKRAAVELSRTAGIAGIQQAVDLGLLELHTFEGTDTDEMCLEFMADCIAAASQSPVARQRASAMAARDKDIIAELVERVSSAVSDSSTYPLLDGETGELVRALINEGKIDVRDATVRRAREVHLAGHLLGGLPLFEEASVEEILDIRKELERPLIRFRGAVSEFSDQIGETPWDADFKAESERVFRRDVAPTMLDIEDMVKSNSYLATLIRKASVPVLAAPGGPLLSMVVSRLSSLPDELAVTMALLIPFAAIAPVIYDAHKCWQEKQQTIEQNRLFFYYEAGRQLGSQGLRSDRSVG
ncbi:MAG: hypothetical protein WCD51_03330 [Anaerolineae bacterium]